MKYMIHACPQRMWYVEEFLIPSMKEQGIKTREIEVWCDTDEKGNLLSCMESFLECGARKKKQGSGTWHLQDDILISRGFAKRTREYDAAGEEIVCGFAHRTFGNFMESGRRPVVFLWYSFPCIRIPDEIAGECARWFFDKAIRREQWKQKIEQRKGDDWFFRNFLLESYPDMRVLQPKPNLVEHVDWLIGGTTINKQRSQKQTRAEYFQDADLVEKLEEQLKNR